MRRFLYLIVFLVFAQACFAFESDEHAFISSNGLLLAQQHMQKHKDSPCQTGGQFCDDINGISTAFLKENYASQIQLRSTFYGLLSVFGDYQFDPYDYFKVWQSFSGLPESRNDARFNQEYIDLIEEVDGVYRLFHASHNNADHFQEQLMFSYWWWHKIAIEKAAEGNLFAAMLFNSFADHFLEDFFAPGHLQTPRENMNDAYATAVHDFYNKEGAKFRVKRGNSLLPLLETAKKINLGALNKTSIANNTYTSLESILENNTNLKLYGDHTFTYKQTHEQQLFMSIIIARSILDVYDTYINSREANTYVLKNSFGQFYWTSRVSQLEKLAQLENPVTPAVGKIHFGEYESKRHILPFYSTVFDVGVSHNSTLLNEANEEQSATEIDVMFSVFGSYIYPTGNYSRLSNGNAKSRFINKLFPFGGSLPVGFTYLTDDYTTALKLKIEPMWHFSKYSAFVGAPLSFGQYKHKSEDLDDLRFGGGVEIGMGFGMLHFVGGLMLDSLYGSQGELDRMVFVKAGVRIIFPGSRIPGAKKI